MSVFGKKESECCGCNACVEICPRHCICMVENEKGFLYPQVDRLACIQCNVCEKVCPFDTSNLSLRLPLKAYAAWSKNRKRHLISSSGGAAYVLSSYIIQNRGGVVYGCAADGMSIGHVRIENISDLYRLQGSKYVQSDVRGIFRRVKDDLKVNRPVLFIGTPCQVAGLKNYIGLIPKHLYLVDLICHGVPSQKMLRDHVNYVSKGINVCQISFRNGNDIILSITGDNFMYEASVWKEPYKDLYIKGFLDGMIYRSSCYKCHFACLPRVSDITLGDFWGLKNQDRMPINARDGVSLLLPVSDKGISLIEAVQKNFVIYERNMEEAINGNPQLRHSAIQGRRSCLFNLLYPTLPFDMAMNIVVADHKIIWKVKKNVYHFLNDIRNK